MFKKICQFIGIGLCLGLTPLTQASQTLVIGYSDVEFFPYEIGNSEVVPEPPGISIDLIRLTAADQGLSVTFKRLPNVRVLETLRTGMIDGACTYSFKPERTTLGRYPMRNDQVDEQRRITRVSYYLFTRKDSPVIWDGENIKNYSMAIGANFGYSIIDDLIKMGVTVEPVKKTEQNLGKLMLGRIDGFAAQDITTDFHIESGKYGEIIKQEPPLITKDYFLLFSRQFYQRYPKAAEAFWTRLAELSQTKTAELAQQYEN